MALVYSLAQLHPSKIELLREWVPAQRWLGGADTSTIEAAGAYRFDDPDGEVGVETHLLRTADGRVLQVPLTYRAAPLAGAERSLIATMQHTVLGERWVYDGARDPVYAQALATAILTGGTHADVDALTATGVERREAKTRVSGSGSPDAAVPPVGSMTCADDGTATVIRAGDVELRLLRLVDSGAADAGAHTLTGRWPGQDAPALLALAWTG